MGVHKSYSGSGAIFIDMSTSDTGADNHKLVYVGVAFANLSYSR